MTNILKDMKVGLRLGAGFAVVFLLMGILTAVAITKMATMQGSMQEIVGDNNMKITKTRNMRDAARNQSVFVRNIALATEKGQMEAEFKRIVKERKIYNDNQGKLLAAVKSEAGKAILAKINDSEQLTDPLIDKAVEIGMKGRQEEVAGVLFKEVRPVQKMA